MQSLTDEDADPDAFAPPSSRNSRRGPLAPVQGLAKPVTDAVALGRSAAGFAVRQTLATVRQPQRLTRLARDASDDASTVGKLLFSQPDPVGTLKGDQRAAHQVAWSTPLPLADVKAAGRALGATINDVLGAAVAGALRHHLEGHGEPAEEVKALVPYNLRPAGRPMSRGLGNRFGLVLLPLPVDVEDPVERVRLVHERMDAVKRSNEGAISFAILTAMGRTMAAVEERLIDFFTAKGTLVLTNVPGPRARISVCGAQVAGVLVWAPASGSLGMSVSIFSYAGEVTVGFLADAGLVEDPQALADDFCTEVAAITAATTALA
jgi:WS/DGAT/MGAT family acyltransferase